jgi:hypothetical protein
LAAELRVPLSLQGSVSSSRAANEFQGMRVFTCIQQTTNTSSWGDGFLAALLCPPGCNLRDTPQHPLRLR